MSRRFNDRSASPALKKNPFAAITAGLWGEVMRVEGAANKTAFSLMILIVSASWIWNMGMAGESPMGLVMIGFIGAFTLLLTLAWLYMEILRLLSLLRSDN